MATGVPSEDSLPVYVLLRVDEVCRPFEDAWKAQACGGTQPAIEAYLGDAPGPERAALLRELLKLDLHYRKQRGERPTAEDFRRWFAGHEELLERVFAEAGLDSGQWRTAGDGSRQPAPRGKVATSHGFLFQAVCSKGLAAPSDIAT